MKKTLRHTLAVLLLIMVGSTFTHAQDDINIPGFGRVPFVQKGDLYSMNIGKLGKFEFTGSIQPLALSTTVGMDELKAFPGATVMSFLGFQDIELSVKQEGLGIAANFGDAFKDELLDEIRKIDIPGFSSVVGTVLNTLEIRESQAELVFGANGDFTGKLDFNIFVFGAKLPIPVIKGTLDTEEIIKVIVETVKDEGLDILGNIGELVADAAVKSAKVVAKSAEEAFEFGKVVAQHSTHTKEKCDKDCVPSLARKMAKPMRLGGQRALGEFYAEVIPVVKNIQGETLQQTAELRKQYIQEKWDGLTADIDKRWAKIRSDKSYVKIYISPSSAENGGRIFRKNIDKEKNKYEAYKELILSRILYDTGLEWKNENIYMIRSKQYNTYWDFKGEHFNAEQLGGKLFLSPKDSDDKQGADRLFKVSSDWLGGNEYFYFQPQHSNHKVGVNVDKNKRGPLELHNRYGEFIRKKVGGQANTYYLIHHANNLYVTANENGEISFESFSNKNNQKWVFEWADDPFIMKAPDENYRFAIKNCDSHLNMNILKDRVKDPTNHKPFKASSRAGKRSVKVTTAHKKDGKGSPDQYFRLYPVENSDDNYFNLKPMLGPNILNVMDGEINDGSPIGLWKKTDELKVQFRFIYAGEAMTFFIQERNSGKFLQTASRQKGAEVQIHSFTGKRNQMWKLESHKEWIVPKTNQKFYIKAVYCNNEYWDPTSEACEVGAKIQTNPLSAGNDRIFSISNIGGVWLNIKSEVSGKVVEVPAGAKNGTQLSLNNKNNSPGQQFAFEFTSPTTFRIYSRTRKYIDISGDSQKGDGWKSKGQKIQTNEDLYVRDRHWQLVYADGLDVGEPYDFITGAPLNAPKTKVSSKGTFIKYNKSAGCGSIFRNGKIIKTHCDWRTTWHTIIQVGCINGTQDELFLFYDKGAGLGKTYRIDRYGNMTLLSTYDNWRKSWTKISWEGTDACNGKIKFQQVDGFSKVYTCDAAGKLREYTGSIIPSTIQNPKPGAGNGSTTGTEIKYHKSEGCGSIYRNGEFLKKHCGWRKTWHSIVKIGCINSDGGDAKFLFYDARAGVGKVYKVTQNGEMKLLANYSNWKKSWAKISWEGGSSCNGTIKFQQADGYWKRYTCDSSGKLKLHSSK